jgi:NADPH2:quinone reductase
MRALLSHRVGGPETLVLEEIPEPTPEAGQVRINVRAVGANFPDLLIIQDLYQSKQQRPFSPGSELAGTIDVIGPKVRNLWDLRRSNSASTRQNPSISPQPGR